MAGSANRSRKVKTGTDRLSSLDDSLLLHILSLLETLDAVRTCILSKRWRDLWNSLSVLKVDWSKINAALKFSRKGFTFSNLVNQFLIRRDNCELHEVRLVAREYWDYLFPAEVVVSLVQYAVKHGVREMFLDVSDLSKFDFPRCLSQCQSLRKLELFLKYSEFTILPKKMGLTALTSLCLQSIIFSKDNFDGSLFSGSPNLQTLHLMDIYCEGLVTFDIHAPSLRTLKFELYSGYGLDDCKVVIIAPKLTTFTFFGPKPITCSVDASSLEDVSIDWYAGKDLGYVDVDFLNVLVSRSIKMVNEFRVARCLTMSLETIKVISALPTLLDGHLLKFENLNHLTIRSLYKQDVVLPPCILKYFINSEMTLEVCQSRFNCG